MKSVRLTLRHDSETIHPMHRFVAEHDAFDSYRLVHWNFSGDAENVLLFHVVGDPAVYEAALEETDGITSFDVTRRDDRSFSVYVRDRPDDVGEGLLEAFSARSLVPVPPLEYRDDWTVRFSLVGEPDDLRNALESVPDGIGVAVERVGEYDAGGRLQSTLTGRQLEALQVAREVGYYEVPREASVEDVAGELGCAPGTAAEHLRKAEQAVIDSLEL